VAVLVPNEQAASAAKVRTATSCCV